MSAPTGNLTREYTPDALIGWEGCTDKDCLPGCNFLGGHCERLAQTLCKNGWKPDDGATCMFCSIELTDETTDSDDNLELACRTCAAAERAAQAAEAINAEELSKAK